MRILVIDVGGTHVKVLATGRTKWEKMSSGPKMTPARMVAAVRAATAGWEYDAVSIGYPGPAVHGRPLSEPRHLGHGWVGFDFTKALRSPSGENNQRRADASVGKRQRETNALTWFW